MHSLLLPAALCWHTLLHRTCRVSRALSIWWSGLRAYRSAEAYRWSCTLRRAVRSIRSRQVRQNRRRLQQPSCPCRIHPDTCQHLSCWSYQRSLRHCLPQYFPSGPWSAERAERNRLRWLQYLAWIPVPSRWSLLCSGKRTDFSALLHVPPGISGNLSYGSCSEDRK